MVSSGRPGTTQAAISSSRPGAEPAPVVADQLVGGAVVVLVPAGAVGAPGDGGDDLVGRLAAVQRRDERLDDRRRPVEGAGVAPGLQEVGLVDVPQAQPG